MRIKWKRSGSLEEKTLHWTSREPENFRITRAFEAHPSRRYLLTYLTYPPGKILYRSDKLSSCMFHANKMVEQDNYIEAIVAFSWHVDPRPMTADRVWGLVGALYDEWKTFTSLPSDKKRTLLAGPYWKREVSKREVVNSLLRLEGRGLVKPVDPDCWKPADILSRLMYIEVD